MAKMTQDEREKFLAGLHVGVIAIERPDRAPLSVPVWYSYEPGGEVSFATESDSVKYRLVEQARRFSLTAQDEQPPYRYVTVEGDVTSIGKGDDAELRALAVRYLGEEAGNAYADESLTPNTAVIRMRPARWLTVDYSKD